MKLVYENTDITSSSRKVKEIQSDKTMNDFVSKLEEMQAEGRAKIVRSCSYDELKKLPPEQLRPSERALIMYCENKKI